METLVTPVRVKRLFPKYKKCGVYLLSMYKVCTNNYSSNFWVVNRITGTMDSPPGGKFPWHEPNDYTLQQGDVVFEIPHTSRLHMHILVLPDEIAEAKEWLSHEH